MSKQSRKRPSKARKRLYQRDRSIFGDNTLLFKGRNKIPRVGDEIYRDGCKFIVCEVKISTNLITGSMIINTRQIIAL